MPGPSRTRRKTRFVAACWFSFLITNSTSSCVRERSPATLPLKSSGMITAWARFPCSPVIASDGEQTRCSWTSRPGVIGLVGGAARV